MTIIEKDQKDVSVLRATCRLKTRRFQTKSIALQLRARHKMLLSKKLYKCGGWIEVDTFCHIHGETEGFVCRAFHAPRRRRTRIGGLRIENCRPTVRWSNSIEIVERTVSQIFSYPARSFHWLLLNLDREEHGNPGIQLNIDTKNQGVFLVKICLTNETYIFLKFCQDFYCIRKIVSTVIDSIWINQRISSFSIFFFIAISRC